MSEKIIITYAGQRINGDKPTSEFVYGAEREKRAYFSKFKGRSFDIGYNFEAEGEAGEVKSLAIHAKSVSKADCEESELKAWHAANEACRHHFSDLKAAKATERSVNVDSCLRSITYAYVSLRTYEERVALENLVLKKLREAYRKRGK